MVTVITRADIPVDSRRGGNVQTLLSPKTVGSTSGFMGAATIAPGDFISEHYHPYSEEFMFVIEGELDAQINDESHIVHAGQGLLIPKESRHRLVNHSDADSHIVFHLGPLAPRPDLGHVDTENRDGSDPRGGAPVPAAALIEAHPVAPVAAPATSTSTAPVPTRSGRVSSGTNTAGVTAATAAANAAMNIWQRSLMFNAMGWGLVLPFPEMERVVRTIDGGLRSRWTNRRNRLAGARSCAPITTGATSMTGSGA